MYLKSWLGTEYPFSLYEVVNHEDSWLSNTATSDPTNIYNELANNSISGYSGGKQKSKNTKKKSKEKKLIKIKNIEKNNISSKNIETAFKKTVEKLKNNKCKKEKLYFIEIIDLRLNNNYKRVFKI